MSTKTIRAVEVFMVCVVWAFCGDLSAAVPPFQGLGFLSSSPQVSEARAVSADGSTVIGTSYSEQGQQGFVWTSQAGMTGLGDFPPGGQFRTVPQAISGDGSLLGGYRGSVLDSLKPVVWDADRTVTELPYTVTNSTMSFNSGLVTGMSADGSVLVGTVGRDFDGGNFWHFRACYWDSDRNLHLVTLPDATIGSEMRAVSLDGSRMLIQAFTSGGSAMYVGSDSTGFFVIHHTGISPLGFSGNGNYIFGDQMVRGEGNVRHIYGFRWDGTGDIEMLDPLDGFVHMMVGSSNADASMIGGAARMTPDSMDLHAFLWQEGIGTQLLADILTGTYGLDLDGWHLMGLTGISDDGTVLCGYGINPDGFEEAWVAVIPEPATLSLLIAGMIALRKYRR